MAFVEVHSVYLREFGDDGLLGGQAVRVIFDSPALRPLLGDAQASATEPQAQLPTAQVPASSYGLPLALPQGNFKVREHLPDGTGWSVLLLTEA